MATFGDEGDLIRHAFNGEIDDVFGDAQFQIELALYALAEEADIAIVDMAAVFAEVDGDAIRAAEFGFDGGPDGVGFVAAPRLAEGRDVVDVDAEFDHLRVGL